MLPMHPRNSQPLPHFPPPPQNDVKVVLPYQKTVPHEKPNSESQLPSNNFDDMKSKLNNLLQKTEFVINGHRRNQSFSNHEKSQRSQNQKLNPPLHQKQPPPTHPNLQHHNLQSPPQFLKRPLPPQNIPQQPQPPQKQPHPPQGQPVGQTIIVSPHKNMIKNNGEKETTVRTQYPLQFQRSKNATKEMSLNRPPSYSVEMQGREEKGEKEEVREEKQVVEQNPEQSVKKKKENGEEELSWTKYIGLELRNEKLEKQLKMIEGDYNTKLEGLKKQLENRERTVKNIGKKLIDEKKQYQERIAQMKKENEIKLSEKNAHIKKLVEELSGLTLEQKEEIVRKKIKEIIQENERVKIELAERQTQIKNLEHTLHLQEQRIAEKEQAEELLQKQLLQERSKVGRILKERSFDEILKIQLDEIVQLKENLQQLHDENSQLRESVRNSQHETEKIFNEIKISEIKEASCRNRIATEMGIKLNEKDNVIKSLEKKMLTMEDKYKSAIREIKQKDQFLKQHLVGRTDEVEVKEYIENMLERYSKEFGQGKEGQVEEMEREARELRRKLSYYEENW